MSTAGAIIRGDGEGERRWFAGGGVHVMKATAEETDGAFILLENRMTRGKTTLLHTHPNLDETLIVLEGEMLYNIKGEVSDDPEFIEIVQTTFEPDSALLLCSDGLWGTLSDDEIAAQMGRHSVSHAVPELVEDALRKAGNGSDNVTVLALEWETPDAFESTQGVSTDSISDDVFASTIQAGPLDGLVDDLDDEAIERSIAEINEAIRRSAARKA